MSANTTNADLLLISAVLDDSGNAEAHDAYSRVVRELGRIEHLRAELEQATGSVASPSPTAAARPAPHPRSDPFNLDAAVAWLRHLATDPLVCNTSMADRQRYLTVLAELDRLDGVCADMNRIRNENRNQASELELATARVAAMHAGARALSAAAWDVAHEVGAGAFLHAPTQKLRDRLVDLDAVLVDERAAQLLALVDAVSDHEADHLPVPVLDALNAYRGGA